MNIEGYMRLALEEARKAFSLGEVPVGAVVVSPEGEVIGRGHNLKESTKDPTAHAEIVAIREAAQTFGDWRLEGCALFVTVEPCLMCCGAIIQARIPRLFFGACDPKFGAVVSLMQAFDLEGLNHRVDYVGGVMEDECVQLLRSFFRRLR